MPDTFAFYNSAIGYCNLAACSIYIITLKDIAIWMFWLYKTLFRDRHSHILCALIRYNCFPPSYTSGSDGSKLSFYSGLIRTSTRSWFPDFVFTLRGKTSTAADDRGLFIQSFLKIYQQLYIMFIFGISVNNIIRISRIIFWPSSSSDSVVVL